jgi:hypothetical protein
MTIEKESRTMRSSQPLTAPDFCGSIARDRASRAGTPRAGRPAVRGS